jgi:protein-disulfide isomerase
MTLFPRLVRSLLLAGLVAASIPGQATAQTAAAAKDTLIAPRAKGLTTAPVTVYEMGDFQCPVCKRFFDSTYKVLEKEYIATGKVHWIYINFPLSSIHPNAEAAAEFAMCASKQGKFWPTHDRLYEMQQTWAPLKDPGQYFLAQTAGLGLNRETMVKCLSSGAGTAMVRSDATGAARAGANSTPTFYIEGGLLAGAYPLPVFRQVLDSIIKVKSKK